MLGASPWNRFLEWVWWYIYSRNCNRYCNNDKYLKIYYCTELTLEDLLSFLCTNVKSGFIFPKKSLLPAHVPLLCLLVLAQSRKCSSALESLLRCPGQPWNTPHPRIRTYFITFPLSKPAAMDHNLPAVTFLVLIFSFLFSSFFSLFTYLAPHSQNWWLCDCMRSQCLCFIIAWLSVWIRQYLHLCLGVTSR